MFQGFGNSFRKWLVIFFIFFLAGGAGLYRMLYPAFIPDSAPILIKIEKGAALQTIAETLRDNKVVRSKKFFLLLSNVSGKSKKFKHGTYLMERNSYWKTIRRLELGLTHRIKVTIPEGWSAYQIAERLQGNGVILNLEEFVRQIEENGLEGTLFPETYFFEPGSDPETVIQTMVREFKRHYNEPFVQREKELKMTQRQVLTLASIIEREARMDPERPIISSVYHNRLKKRQPLEADPTVQYALSRGRYWKEGLTYKDLKTDSPYNTYRRQGLPPAPICNPGLKSIEAALFPAETRYYYFFADGQGAHIFSETYKQHIQKQIEQRKSKKKIGAKSH